MVVLIQPEIPHTIEELERIEARVPVINAQGPMIELVKLVFEAVEVIPQLGTAFIAHCACHQTQHHGQKRFESAFSGSSSANSPSNYQPFSPNGMLAFLATCQTVMGDKTPDEVIHPDSALLFVRLQGVVGPMW